jgi:hypothetical protein
MRLLAPKKGRTATTRRAPRRNEAGNERGLEAASVEAAMGAMNDAIKRINTETRRSNAKAKDMTNSKP